MLERVGSEWGGFWVDMDLVPFGSTAICAGIGNDITFDRELIARRRCHVVGLDPTQRAREHIEALRASGTITDQSYVFLPCALYGKAGVELRCHSFRSIFRGGGDLSVSMALPDLLNDYPDTSLIKMDIEGSEYPVIEAMETLPETVLQVCMEFHHRLGEVPYGLEDTKAAVKKIMDFGFDLTVCEKDYQDVLFTRKS